MIGRFCLSLQVNKIKMDRLAETVLSVLSLTSLFFFFYLFCCRLKIRPGPHVQWSDCPPNAEKLVLAESECTVPRGN